MKKIILTACVVLTGNLFAYTGVAKKACTEQKNSCDKRAKAKYAKAMEVYNALIVSRVQYQNAARRSKSSKEKKSFFKTLKNLDSKVNNAKKSVAKAKKLKSKELNMCSATLDKCFFSAEQAGKHINQCKTKQVRCMASVAKYPKVTNTYKKQAKKCKRELQQCLPKSAPGLDVTLMR